jgi:hypothetical protein
VAHEGATIIHVGWEEPDSDGGSAITGYKVEVSEDGLAYTDLLASTAHFHATQTGLEEGDTRYFRVKAINANGTGAAIIGSETTEEGVNLDLHGPWISAPTCDAGTTITIVDNTNTLQDVVISMDWEIEGVIENVEWFMDKYRGDSYLGSDEGDQNETDTLTISPDSDWPTEGSRVEITMAGETAASDYPTGTGPGTKIIFIRKSGNTTCLISTATGGL